MTKTDTLYDEIKQALDNMVSWELISVHNEYCDAVNYYDDRIYSMDEIDDIFCDLKPSEIIRNIGHDFNYCDDYFKFTIYGVESFNYIDDEIDTEELAEYIADNDDDLYNDDIRAILDEYAPIYTVNPDTGEQHITNKEEV